MPETLNPDTLNNVRRSLTVFHEGFQALEEALEQPALQEAVSRATDMIHHSAGRLIVTGLGKSGHVGSKLAATFSSTGTPAFFVHPAEASHGDLGMIRSDDVILMLSWSGETRELSDIAGYARRFKVPLIVMTSGTDSTLARSADVRLILPKVREACPHDLAPTTSTLLQLALGDAMAVNLLQLKGFTEASFHNFHPGGKLGAALRQVQEIMHGPDLLPLVGERACIFDALSALSARNFGIVGVTDEGGKLTGVLTDGDFRRYLERQSKATMQEALYDTAVAEVMTRDPLSMKAEMLAADALAEMQGRRISAAFILQDGRPAGLVTLLQLLGQGVR
ncbi:KpsF/GutQ family sugar-phosphate isomerase [Tranquillimonas alkanivorans]|uniref:Arabinose-5-phosphate isomerase n=1 Tax=Tranquillimonas alkanivorans TaxID=441119 RepID=A0A1I5L6B5_9RHOB|nr:KpsF/GutQ family sugar-phosphate isomerase [Tranquillimonas alkanivorans]SFO92748.1 arabinose-5-phosphate isomerase [Tranquillimonas alkanivorans]